MEKKSTVLLRELTGGSAYNKFPIWFRDCFYVIFTDKGLTIWNWLTFTKIIIPKQFIQKLISEPVTFWGVTQNLLRVIHSYPDAPKIICFRSANYNSWFEAFEKSSIPIEDNEQIRYTAVSSSDWYTKISFLIGIIVFLLVIIALIILPNRRF